MSFCALAGVADAQLAGDEIVGHWKQSLVYFHGLNGKGRSVFSGLPVRRAMVPLDTGVRTLTEELVNWRDDPQSILRFVRRFGALGNPEQGGEFRQSLRDWRNTQRGFRSSWWHYSPSQIIPAPPFSNPEEGEKFRETMQARKHQPVFGGKILRPPGPGSITALVEVGEWFMSIGGRLFYVVKDLARFLSFELNSYPAERLRICARPNCETPYFTARHLRQNYCSELCAQWGQRQSKKQWWTENGNEWRKRHTKRNRGGKNVTRKTR